MFPESNRALIEQEGITTLGNPDLIVEFRKIYLSINAAIRSKPSEVLFASSRYASAMMKNSIKAKNDEGGILITGKAIKLRTVRKSDVLALYTLSSDLDNPGEYMPVQFLSETDFFKEFEQTGFWKDNSGKLIIEDLQGAIVGEIGLFKAAHYLDGRELYYRVFEKYRGNGYAGEAVSLLSKTFFDMTNFSRLQAVTISGNSISEHILKKANYTFEGTMKKARYFKGKLVDLNMFSVTRDDYC